MNKFSEAFEAGRAAMAGGALAGSFVDLKPGLARVFGADGPAQGEAEQLDNLRKLIETGKKALVGVETNAAKAEAKVIVDGAGEAHHRAERAATLKMLRHLYREKSTGGQTIWVYAPPRAYTKWIFDEVAGASAPILEALLAKPATEVYSAEQRVVMAAAIQEARAVTLAVATKLGAASDVTRSVVRRYFGKADSTEKNIIATMNTLAAGYQKIANACNGGSIVISDEPVDRNSGGWKDWAFIYTSEKMPVIYLQGAWLAKADQVGPSNQSPLYRCVRTIIHELSHKEVGTEDIVYGPKGLMPEGSSALTAEYALHNADSWAYFAVDLLGYLTGPDKENGKTASKAILQVPTRSLTAV